MQQKTKYNRLAIASFVLAVLAALMFLFVGFFGFMLLGLPAFVSGMVAQKQTRSSRGSAMENRMAFVGIVIGAFAVLGWIGTGITFLVTLVAYSATRDTMPPVIMRVEPPDGATLPAGSHVVIKATYSDQRAVDEKSVRLVVDGVDVTSKTLISDASLSYGTDFDPGQHVVLVELRDTSGNKASRAWQFSLAPP